jgi:CheY-like chemotaxis protein
LLTHWGYEVSPAENLQGGLSKLEGEPIDITLCDIPLPDRTGYAVLSEARRPGKQVLAIALSGYGYPSDVQIAELIGFDHQLVQSVPLSSPPIASPGEVGLTETLAHELLGVARFAS